MTSCPPQMLFVDTLTENLSNYDEGILEHIQFQHPVYISEVRVVMQSFKVKFQDIVLEGRTHPSKGEIVIYGSDLNRKDKSSTFEFLSRFSIDRYEKWRQLLIEKQIPTNRLIIRSSMKSLTIAIIGVLARKSTSDVPSSSPLSNTPVIPGTWTPAQLPVIPANIPNLSIQGSPNQANVFQSSVEPIAGDQFLSDEQKNETKTTILLSSESEEDFTMEIGENYIEESDKIDEFVDSFSTVDSIREVHLDKFEFKQVRRSSVQRSVDMLNDFQFDQLHDYAILNCVDWLNELSTDTLLSVCDTLSDVTWHRFLCLLSQCIDERFILFRIFTRPDQQRDKLRLWCNSIELVGLLMSMDISDSRKLDVVEQKWQHKLLDLFESSLMGTPFRLRIIRSLDRSLSGKYGFPSFLQASSDRKDSAYDRCVAWMSADSRSNGKNSRTVLFMTRLLGKVHFFLEANKIVELSERLRTEVNTYSSINVGIDVKQCVQWIISVVSADCLEEREIVNKIFRAFVNVSKALKFSSAVTELPSKSSTRHISKISDDSFQRIRFDHTRDRQSLYKLLTECDLIGHLGCICSHCCEFPVQFLSVFYEFSLNMFHDLAGINFLIDNQEKMTILISYLSRFEQAVPAVRVICYGIHSLASIQKIIIHPCEYKPLEDLFSIYMIHPDGKNVVSNILGEKYFFSQLFELLKDDLADKSPRFRLAALLLTGTLTKMSKATSCSLGLMRDFAVALYKKLDGSSSKTMKNCCEWLIPCTSLKAFDWTDCKTVAEDLHNLTSRTENPLKARVAVSLKLLEHMCVPYYPAERSWTHGAAMCEFYSADGLSVLCTILERIFAMFSRSWQLGLPFDPHHRDLSDDIIRSTMKLLKEMLLRIRDAMGIQHKNISPVRPLFHIYCALPACVSVYATDNDVEALRMEIVDCLCTYRITGEQENEDSPLKDSGWIMMLKEILKLTLSAPQFYLAGTSLLCSLFPSTLPMYCINPGKAPSADLLKSTRKEFACSIKPVIDDLLLLIQILALNSNSWLQQALRRFSSELADLSADLCMLITRQLFDQFYDETAQKDESSDSKIYSSYANSILSLICALASIPSCKAALLILIHPKFEHSKYFTHFCNILNQFNIVSEQMGHLYCQASIASMVQSLCDPAIALNMEDVLVTNIFPSAAAMEKIVQAFVIHIGDHNQPSTSTALALVCLIQIYNEYPDGSNLVKSKLMESDEGAISSLVEKLDYKFDKDSVDYLNALSVAFEFLAVLKPREGPSMENCTLRKLFKWTPGCTDHPLHGFSALLSTVVQDEKEFLEEVRNFKDVISVISEHSQWLISNLDSECSEGCEHVSDNLFDKIREELKPEDLSDQFNNRTLITDNERYIIRASQCSSWWVPRIAVNCTSVPMEDLEDLTEMSPFDLDSLLINYCKTRRPNLGPLQALNQEYNECFQCLDSSRHRKLNDTIIATSQGPGHRNYVAPMRGFGFGRNLIGRSFLQSRSVYSQTLKRLFDPFRSRPQNTSRPPSMHVDDFYQIETFGQTKNLYENTAIRQATFMARRGGARRLETGWNFIREG